MLTVSSNIRDVICNYKKLLALMYDYRKLLAFLLFVTSCFLLVIKYSSVRQGSASRVQRDDPPIINNLDQITKHYVPDKVIRIYNGDGVAPDCINDLLNAFNQYQPCTITAQELKSKAWMSTCRLLIIPGGRDLPYCNDLHGDAVRNIQSFVNAGGAYIGTCAGAYFASSRVEFGVGTDIEVVGDRELNIFPGVSAGPYFRDFNYGQDTEKWIKIQCADGKTRDVFHHGGGYFANAQNYPNTTILGRYGENEAAIIKVQFPNGGLALLSHVHFETLGCWPKWQYFISQQMDLGSRLADDRPVEGEDFDIV